MLQPGRKYGTLGRHGYSGMENEEEIKGEGNLYDTKYRMYDPRIGRWLSVDALSYVGAGLSPYQFSFNNPIAYNDPSGLWPWESKHVRAARRFANETGGEFKKIKRDGATWATVSSINENGSQIRVFKPSSEINAKFSAAVAGIAANKATIQGIERLLEGTGVRLSASLSPLRFLGPAAVIATMPLTLSGDNLSQPERIAQSDKYMTKALEKGDLAAVQEWVKDWNEEPRNQQNKIIFRYMSTAEFDNRISPDGAFAVAPPLDRDRNLAVKFITPDIYATSQGAKAALALPTAPDIAIWTYEVEILATKMPSGPGKYQVVKPKYGEDGGGLEATIIQPFPIHGFYPLIK
jgi:RHS repeat-associated protein